MIWVVRYFMVEWEAEAVSVIQVWRSAVFAEPGRVPAALNHRH